jgi:hypothetical protein
MLNFSMYRSVSILNVPIQPSIKALYRLIGLRNLCLMVHRIAKAPYLFNWYMSSAIDLYRRYQNWVGA